MVAIEVAKTVMADMHSAFIAGGAPAMEAKLVEWLERYARTKVQAFKDKDKPAVKPKAKPKKKPLMVHRAKRKGVERARMNETYDAFDAVIQAIEDKERQARRRVAAAKKRRK